MSDAIVYIDLLELDEQRAKTTLLAGIERQRAKPAVAPGFPGGSARPAGPAPAFPGTLPPVWNVPHLRNPQFTGREQLLDELAATLADLHVHLGRGILRAVRFLPPWGSSADAIRLDCRLAAGTARAGARTLVAVGGR